MQGKIAQYKAELPEDCQCVTMVGGDAPVNQLEVVLEVARTALVAVQSASAKDFEGLVCRFEQALLRFVLWSFGKIRSRWQVD